MNEIVVAVKWKKENGKNTADFLALSAGKTWEDMVGNYSPAPIYLIRARVGDGTLGNVQASNKMIILARRTYEIVDGNEVESFNNFDDQPSAAQLNTMKNLILPRFPGMDEDKLKSAGKEILKQGLTREQIINKLIVRWHKL